MIAEPEVTKGDANRVEWGPASDAATYEVQCDDDADFSTPFESMEVPSLDILPTSYATTFTGLGDVDYWYRVRGVTLTGVAGEWSDPVSSKQDSSAPWFSNIAADPAVADRGTNITLTFQASETLASGPQVSINGHAAVPASQNGSQYTYTYLLRGHDVSGPATIAISGTDAVGYTGTTIDTSSLTNTSENSATNWVVFE